MSKMVQVYPLYSINAFFVPGQITVPSNICDLLELTQQPAIKYKGKNVKDLLEFKQSPISNQFHYENFERTD